MSGNYELLKPVYDDLKAAIEAKQQILAQMTAAYNDGTEEGKATALELRPKLEEAQKKVDELNETYQSLLKASKPDEDVIQDFLPTSKSGSQQDSEEGKKTMSRSAFDSLDAEAKMKFIKGGGQITD